MQCFNHPDRPAVGLCQACQRGLCPECLTDTGLALACKDRCEERVRGMTELISQNVRNMDLNRKSLDAARALVARNIAMYLSLGVVFLFAAAIIGYSDNAMVAAFPAVIGGLFVLFGLAQRRGAQYPKVE